MNKQYSAVTHFLIMTKRLIADLAKQNEESSRKLSKIAVAPLDPAAMQNAILEHNFYRIWWAKRKAQCLESVDNLADGMEKKTKEVTVRARD